LASDGISLADVVAGVSVPSLPSLGLALDGYPKLQAWCDRLNSGDYWQQTQACRELVEAFKAPMKELIKVRAQQYLNNDEINDLIKSDLNKFPVAIER
jgi:glutathione S-transferase